MVLSLEGRGRLYSDTGKKGGRNDSKRKGDSKGRILFRLGVGSEEEAAAHRKTLQETLRALPLIIRVLEQLKSIGTNSGENMELAICQLDKV